MTEHNEELDPQDPQRKKYRISYFAYSGQIRMRAYKTVFAKDPEDAKKRAKLNATLIYDITEI